MSTALSFALVTVFALGIPTLILACVVLDRKRSLDRLFLFLQGLILLLMLAEALTFFFLDRAAAGSPSAANPLPALRLASHVLLAIFSFAFFLLAAELTAMDRRSAAWRASAAFVLLVAGLAFRCSLAEPASAPGALTKIRRFDPVEFVGLAVLLFPVGLALLRYSKIRNRELARAVLAILAPALVCLPAALLEDYLLSRRSAPDLLFVFPCWYLLFNASILYFGVKRFFLPRSPAAKELDPAVAARISRRYNVSPKEEEVVRLLAEGCTNREIAARLGISPATVRNHVHSVYGKTGTGNRVALTRLYTRR